MSVRQALKAAIAEVKGGKDRRQVFEAYQGQVPRENHLATAIASVARPEAQATNKGLNALLVALLALAGIFKVFGAFFIFSELGLLAALGVALLSVIVPFAFAYEINRFNGQMYGLLVVLCVVGVLNSLVKYSGSVIATGIDVAMLGVIAALALMLKKRLFPGLGFLGARKDPMGRYSLG